MTGQGATAKTLDPGSSTVLPYRAFDGAGSGGAGTLRSGHGALVLTARPGHPASADVDLGLNSAGQIQLGLAAVTGGDLTLDLAYSEQRAHLGDAAKQPLSVIAYNNAWQDELKPPEAGSWQSPTRGGVRWIRLTLKGNGQLRVGRVAMLTRTAFTGPSAYGGSFQSSDPLLNRIWAISAYTESLDRVPAGKGRSVLIDGVKHDGLIWTGDLAMEALTARYTSVQNITAVRNSLQLLACQVAKDGYVASVSPIAAGCPVHLIPRLAAEDRLPEYEGWFAWTLDQYYLASGDRAGTAAMLPAARSAITYLQRRLHGNLLSLNSNEMTWHPTALRAQPTGVFAGSNEVMVLGLRALADLERRIGAPANAAADDAQADATAAALVAGSWDPAAGTLLASPSDPQRGHPQDAAALGVVSGVLSGSAASSALAFLTAHLSTPYGTATVDVAHDPYMRAFISPFIGGWEAIARMQQGDVAGSLALLRTEWGHMITTDPATTTWESEELDGNPVPPGATLHVSLAHGWSTGAVTALSGYVAGLRPTGPGWSSWTLAPQPGPVTSVAATVPIPGGTATSVWVRGNGTFTLTGGAAVGTDGTVTLPVPAALGTVSVDGRVVWANGAPTGVAGVAATPGGVTLTGVSGVHTYRWLG